MKFSVVISVSSYEEDIGSVCTSVLNNKQFVKDVHIIHPTFKGNEQHNKLYLDQLRSNGIQVKRDASYDPANFDNSDVILWIPPYCEMTLGDFNELQYRANTANEKQTHFGLGTTYTLPGFSIFYGYISVMMVIQWVMNVFWNHRKLYFFSDIRGYFLINKGNHKFIPSEYSYLWNIWNPNVMRKNYKNATIYHEQKRESSYSFTKWLIYHNLPFGLWILIFLPIWGFISLSFVSLVANFVFQYNWIVTVSGVGFWILEFIISCLIGFSYSKNNFTLIYGLLFPIYWVMFPAFWLWSKFK